MPLTFSLIEKAVNLATKVFLAVRTPSSGGDSDQLQLVSIIDDVSKKIDSLAKGFAGELSYQLEKQQLERLSSQAKVVKLALEFGNDAMLGTAVASISEQIEYSRLRMNEGKHAWFGPWMIAESVRIEALRIMANSPRAVEVVERETVKFRLHILDHVGGMIIGATESPWSKISDFVEGRNEDILLSLANVQALQGSDVPTGSKSGANNGWRNKVEDFFEAEEAPKAAVWPFPVSSRS
ncbi:hypothetical protein [Duganella sp. FT27W]|uniref:hypothetical protein n=1 Tax=Duganella sp. FT27W TaxID=2654636 RepID=UPI00128D0D18|nr:hypothetical protein [Duganella sp. FT27W]MPQ55110.1 hypothetical protein [Duganella sp. FT27W]